MSDINRIAIIVPRIVWKAPVLIVRSIINNIHPDNDLKISLFYIYGIPDNEIKVNAVMQKLTWRKDIFRNYDIVHTHGFIPDLYARLNRRHIKKHYVTIHNYVFPDLRLKYGLILSWIIGYLWLYSWRKADKLVCVSYSLCGYYSKWFDRSKLFVIYNGIPEATVSSHKHDELLLSIQYFKSKGYLMVGTAGILEKRKGIDFLIKFLKKKKDLALMIIGDGPKRHSLENLSRKLNVADRCLFCGFIKNPDSLYKYLDFFISSSLSEGFGLAVVEAAANKVPLICCDLEVFKELFDDSEITFYRLGNHQSLNQALIIDSEIAIRKSEKAFNRYLKDYTSLKMSHNYSGLYQSV